MRDDERVRRHMNAGGYGDPPPLPARRDAVLALLGLVAGIGAGLLLLLVSR